MGLRAKLTQEISRLPNTDVLGAYVQYYDSADVNQTPLFEGPYLFTFPRTKTPAEVGAEIVAKGKALLAADAQAATLAGQFPAASTVITVTP